jgi:acetolactate synthase I/II/III large subunit
VGQATRTRVGGHLVVETLEALGAEVAFGLPGVHALAIWEALRTSEVRDVPFRTELNAGFAADGYARVTGRPAPLVLSTGPGALISLAALMEAASSHVPVVAIASQIPSELIGTGRGYLHELRDQRASFEPVVKLAARTERHEHIPELLAEAWRVALTPPSGPVFVEIPVDLLTGETDVAPVQDLDSTSPHVPLPSEAALAEASRILNQAENPLLWAGGGVQRSGAWAELAQLAERLRAPVATTFMGKGVLPEGHPLAIGSACYENGLRELVEASDAVLAVGTELGAEITFDYALRFSGRLVQIDAAAERIGATYPALGLVGDAKAVLAALLPRVHERPADGRTEARVAELRARIDRGVQAQGRELELGLLRTIREALPREAVHAWDMTILAYCASAHFPALTPRRFLYPLGSGTLGYAWPAVLGAKLALPESPALAVVGDGGIHYGLTELTSARQYDIAAKLLLVDDGGYGVLREYQRDAYGETHAVELVQPDFPAAVEAFGVPVRETSPESLAADLAWAFETDGPAVLVLKAVLEWIQPTP